MLEFVCQIENGISIEEIENINEVKEQISTKLQVFAELKTQQTHEYKPLVYHLDVAAMYPNIILTNRLQPVSVVDDKMFILTQKSQILIKFLLILDVQDVYLISRKTIVKKCLNGNGKEIISH